MTDYRFPLLCLPEDAAINVLKQMDIFEIFGFSLLSRKTQQLTSAIQYNVREARVEIDEHIEVQIILFHKTFHFIFYEEPSDNLDVTMTSPGYVKMETGWGVELNQKVYPRTGWTMKNWAEHLFKMFNYRRIDAVITDEDGKFNAKSIHAVFPKLQMLCIGSSIPQFIDYTDCFDSVTNMHISKPAQGKTVTSEYQIQKILAQNFKFLCVAVPISLDDLLVANCDVMYAHSNLPENCVNLFLKLWMKGSFLNLKHLFLQILGENQVKILMKGIKYEVNEPDRLKTCSRCGYIEVRGGMDIRRDDGTKATVLMDGGMLTMFVWH